MDQASLVVAGEAVYEGSITAQKLLHAQFEAKHSGQLTSVCVEPLSSLPSQGRPSYGQGCSLGKSSRDYGWEEQGRTELTLSHLCSYLGQHGFVLVKHFIYAGARRHLRWLVL